MAVASWMEHGLGVAIACMLDYAAIELCWCLDVALSEGRRLFVVGSSLELCGLCCRPAVLSFQPQPHNAFPFRVNTPFSRCGLIPFQPLYHFSHVNILSVLN